MFGNSGPLCKRGTSFDKLRTLSKLLAPDRIHLAIVRPLRNSLQPPSCSRIVLHSRMERYLKGGKLLHWWKHTEAELRKRGKIAYQWVERASCRRLGGAIKKQVLGAHSESVLFRQHSTES